jgi:hypothetical protein
MNDIDLINNDKVTVNNLEFELYPDQQYVNINITTKNIQWENIYKSGITLSTSVGYKTYEIYGWELTPETLCEDVCSIAELSETWTNEMIKNTYINLMKYWSNNTMSSCTLWYWVWLNDNFWTNLLMWLWFITPVSNPIFNIAYDCSTNNTARCKSHCDKNAPGRNPFNCWYIHNEITKSWWFTWDTCSWYDSYIRGTACVDMCMSSIFSCLWDDDPLIKKTWIRIKSWDYAWYYLQNPKQYSLTASWQYNKWNRAWQNWWKCTVSTKTLSRVKASQSENQDFIDFLIDLFTSLFWGTTYIYECNQSTIYCDWEYYGTWNYEWLIFLTEDEYKYNCVKWTRTANSSTQNISSQRILYTPEEKYSESCTCEVKYDYSLNKWWIIEWWVYWWLSPIVAQISYEWTELDYIPKPENLVYIDELQDPWVNWNSITWSFKTRRWIQTKFNETYCTKYKNNVCTTTWAFNNKKTYRINDELWFYWLDNGINFYNLACTNETGYRLCVASWCCPSPWSEQEIYTTAISITNNDALEYYCKNFKNIINNGNQTYWYNNKCYWKRSISWGWYSYSNPITIDLNTAKEKYCTNSKNWIRDNEWNICLVKTEKEIICMDINKTKCNNWDPDREWISIVNAEEIKYCKNSDYDSCKTLWTKNIYKNYDYMCWYSMVQQSNSILNIIQSITNMSQTTVNRPKQRWRRLFW